jgi:60 kDa SS-A/Ro ribonucleoprotein
MIAANEDGITQKEVEAIASKYKLPLEMIPTEFRTPSMWEVIAPNLGITAIMRNVGNMSKGGISNGLRKIVLEALTNEDRLKKGRVHPFKMFLAYHTYELGHGIKGKSEWTVDRNILAALENAIYVCFHYGTPTGKNFKWGMDVSTSMTWGTPLGELPITPLDCEAVMALSVLETGDNIEVWGFDHSLREIKLKKGMTIAQANKLIMTGTYGSTDPGLVYKRALVEKEVVDAFIFSTDNEVNTGSQPQMLLEQYRREKNPNAKSIVLATTVSEMSIADPNDQNSLDIAGMSADVPLVISSFVSGKNEAEEDKEE